MTDEIEKQVAGVLGFALGTPAQEIGGLIADKIRFLRWKSAIRTVERAKEIADARGVKLHQPALKFLVPFMENCSLEEDDEDICEYWSQLLTSAAVEFRSGHLLFMRVLREITGSEARLLRVIATCGGVVKPDAVALDEARLNWELFSAPASPLRELDTLSDWPRTKRLAFDRLQRQGIAIEALELSTMRDDVLGGFEQVQSIFSNETLLDGHDQISIDILTSLNVIAHSGQSFDMGNDEDSTGEYNRLEGFAYYLTSMGAAFFSECSGLVENRSESK